MKTPEEIAQEIVDGNYGLDFEHALNEAITQAIKAEREAAQGLLEALEFYSLIDLWVDVGDALYTDEQFNLGDKAREARAKYKGER